MTTRSVGSLLALLATLALAGCGFITAAVAPCTDDTNCPSGFVCGTEGRCVASDNRGEGDTGARDSGSNDAGQTGDAGNPSDGGDQSDAGSDAGPACVPADALTQEANCSCTVKADCAAGNTAKWACTPAHRCLRTCTATGDCEASETCEDLICLPIACANDGECPGGGTMRCIAGSCQAPVAASDVASCVVLPSSAVINASGTAKFSVVAYDAAGRALPYNAQVTWGQTGLASVSGDGSVLARFTSNATGGASGTVTAIIGGAVCTASAVAEYAPPVTQLRVVVISERSSAAGDAHVPIVGAHVVVDTAAPVTTDSAGVAAFTGLQPNNRTISVFATSAWTRMTS
jgi:hypothetical protein